MTMRSFGYAGYQMERPLYFTNGTCARATLGILNSETTEPFLVSRHFIPCLFTVTQVAHCRSAKAKLEIQDENHGARPSVPICIWSPFLRICDVKLDLPIRAHFLWSMLTIWLVAPCSKTEHALEIRPYNLTSHACHCQLWPGNDHENTNQRRQYAFIA